MIFSNDIQWRGPSVTFFLTLVLGALLFSSLRNISLFDDFFRTAIISSTSAFIAFLISLRQSPSTGFVAGLLTISSLALLSYIPGTTDNPISFVLSLMAVLIGSYLRSTYLLFTSFFILLIVFSVLLPFEIAAPSSSLVLIAFFLRLLVEKTSLTLPFPFRGIKKELPFLLAFGTGYLTTVFFFGVFYHVAFLFNPSHSFDLTSAPNFAPNLWYFLYMSTSVISTTGSPLTPTSSVMRLLITLELLTSVAWIVVYFGLLLHRLGNTSSSGEI